MSRRLIAHVVLMAACAAIGCAASHPPVPAGACRRPGDLGDALGIGAFCEPRGATRCPSGTFCLAEVWGGDFWFCTRACGSLADCGRAAPGTECLGRPGFIGDLRYCIPSECPPNDAGAADPDAGLDE